MKILQQKAPQPGFGDVGMEKGGCSGPCRLYENGETDTLRIPANAPMNREVREGL